MTGKTLGHYRVLQKLGEGGMGEVYAAEDLRLHRQVALKILPREMALDPERLQRFQREAQAIAALNHPNVVTIYGVEEADDLHFLTMELVEGKALADLIPPRGFQLPRFLQIAAPLADAISAAHERGIVHRDLKPSNVMIAENGRVKVLDFGLAKLTRETSGPSETATATAGDLTSRHHVIGTAAYMSPEQAEGRPVDARSDIFSLGVVLYEMATGARPFRGDSAISVISSILKDTPPDPASVNPAVPHDLDRIIRRCLAKDPARRFQSAADLRNDLEELQQQTTPRGVLFTRWQAHTRRRMLLAGVAAGVVVIATAAALVWRAREANVPAGPPRAEVAQLTSQPGVEWFPSLSPDGKWLVYAADAGSHRHIYLQSVSGQTPLDISGESPADDDQPSFSPDGERIAFRSSREGGGLFVMGRTGEAVKRVTRTGFRPSWSPDGAALAFVTENVELNPQNAEGTSELWTVDVKTGQTRRLYAGDAVLASWSPHNHRIAFTRRLNDRGIWTVSVTGGEPMPAVQSDVARNWSPAWSPDGEYLYFASDRAGSMNLWRVAIDEVSGRVRGEPEPITTPAPYLAHPSVSTDGARLAYSAALVTTNIQRIALDPVAGAVRGEPSWVTTGSRRWANPDPSPDGSRIVFYSLVQPEGHLYIQRPDGGPPRQLTGDAAKDRLPHWSPDGQWISTFSDRSGHLELWKIRPDGSDLTQMTGSGGSYHAWSPDGSRVAVKAGVESEVERLLIFDPRRPWTEQKPDVLPPFDPPSARFRVNAWSPDGERLAGHLDAGARGIATYSLRSRTYTRVTDSGEWPVWLPDSRHVLFVSGGNAFYIVDTQTKEVRKIFSVTRDVIGPPRLTRDGATAYFTRRVTEADIWLVTLQ
jgi:Tol biopolymer transport system component